MKKLILGVFALGLLFFVACQKESSPFVSTAAADQIQNDVSQRVIKSTELPASAIAVLKADYPGVGIEAAYKSTNGYSVELKNDFVVIFDLKGEHLNAGRKKNPCLQGDTVAVSSLPAAIAAYVTANYAGANIVRATKKADGSYAVKIDSPKKVLIFNADGTFANECTPPPPMHHHHDTLEMGGHDSLDHHGNDTLDHHGNDSIPHGGGGHGHGGDNDSIPHGGGGHGGGGHDGDGDGHGHH